MKTKFSPPSCTLLELFITLAVLALLAALVMPSAVQAQSVEAVPFGTNSTIAANATATVQLGGGVKIDKQHSAALVVKYQNSTTGTSNNIVKLVRGYTYQGTVWYESTNINALSFTNAAANGTPGFTNVFIHQIPESLIGSAEYLKPYNWFNTDTGSGNSTNAALYLLKKIER